MQSFRHILSAFRVLTTGVLIAAAIVPLQAQRTLPAAYSGTASINYVRTWDVIKPTTNVADLTTATPVTTARMTTQYLDGLGRPIQTVVKQGSLVTGPSTTPVDMIDMTEYDEFGREVHKYLPTPANNTGSNTHISDGLFKLNPFAQQQSFYNSYLAGQTGETPGSTTNWAYSKTNYEASPLNRPLEVYAPGVSWVGSESTTKKSVKSNYWINTATDAVRIWTVTDGSTGSFGTYATAATYPAGELYKNATEDEHGKQVIEFKDKSGLVILKKVQLTATKDDGTGKNHEGWLCTYYIYDDLNRLRAVIQPEGVRITDESGWVIISPLLTEQFFRYEYDHRSRMIMKKVPGAGEVYMVYDQRDRLVMMQDASMRTKPIPEWLVTGYDALNRPTHTGIFKNNFTIGGTANRTLSQHLAAAASSTEYPFNPATPPSGSYWELLTQTFYDNYDWVAQHGNMFSIYRSTEHDGHFMTPSNNDWPYPQPMTQSFATRGMITGSYIKVLGTASQYLWSINYYDDKGRIIQTSSYNITGWANHVTMQYDFTGKILRQHVATPKNFTTPRNDYQLTKYEYDELGRLIETKKSLLANTNGTWYEGAEKTIAKQEYDALGQLKTKILAPDYGDDGLETLVYDYNIRGWLLGVNRDYLKTSPTAEKRFGFELGYDKQTNESGQNYAQSQYNGNITGMIWKSMGDGVRRMYNFDYDAVNRLMKADFKQQNPGGTTWDKTLVDYTVIMGNGTDPFTAYNANGNIRRMQQWGLKITGSEQIDDLRYTYIPGTNKLKSVTDFKNDTETKLGDFKAITAHQSTKSHLTIANDEYAFQAISDYGYDQNGNLITDLNKGLNGAIGNNINASGGEGAIRYNHLNLPSEIVVAGKGMIYYTYDATGNKLKKLVLENNATVEGVTTDITTTTTYIDGSVYESKSYSHASLSGKNYADKLLFIGMEEGRIRFVPQEGSTPASFQYDYMLKDHLGNVRMVLTEEEKDASYAATMEEAVATREELLFDNLNNTREGKPAGYPTDTYTDPNAKLAKVNGSGNKIGPAIILKVMAGDKINIRVSSWYKTYGATPGVPVNGLTDLVNTISSGMAGASGGKATASQLTGWSDFSNLIGFFMSEQKSNSSALKPRAYVSWIAYDEQFNYEYQSSGFEQVGDNEEFKVHLRNNLSVTKNGYIYIYVSNETPNIDVFFDNLQVTHNAGPILEETHYYPFGLTMAGISSRALNNTTKNNNKFNGANELQEKEFSDDWGLELYDAQYRLYDHQIGRFNRIDPLTEFFDDLSSYSFAYNNPVLFNDPTGLSPVGGAYGNDYIAGYVKREDGTIFFDPNVHSQDDLDPSSKLIYLGERLRGTRHDGSSVWFDENGQRTTTDPGWETLGDVVITGLKKSPRDFYFYLGASDRHFNGIKDNAELAAGALGTVKRGNLVKNLYDLNKAFKYYNDVNLLKPGATATKIMNGIKGSGAFIKRLGPVGNLISAGSIITELSTGNADAHTAIDATILATTVVVGAVATAPVVAIVAVGAAVYGALDYAFDIGGKVDSVVGKNSRIGKWFRGLFD